MKNFSWMLLLGVILGYSCSQRVRMHVSQPIAQSEPLAASSVQVLSLNDSVPNGAVWIGSLKIGDNGFAKTGNLDTTLRLAREEAAKVGGNLIKITKHKAPSTFGSSCHRIEADIYQIDTPIAIASSLLFDSTYYRQGKCVLHLFRKETWGAALGYDILINDSTLTRSSNNWIETIVLTATGVTTLSASTESSSSVTLNLQPGYHYYIRCGVNLGVLVGRPTLEVVDPEVAKAEIAAIQQTASEAIPTPNTPQQ